MTHGDVGYLITRSSVESNSRFTEKD